MNKETIVIINDRKVVVKKMPLGKYAEVFSALRELPKHLSKIDETSNEEWIEQIPNLISVALPEVAKIVSVASGVPAKELEEEVGLSEFTELVIAIIEVNDVEKVIENVKKLLVRKAFKDVPTAEKAIKKTLTD